VHLNAEFANVGLDSFQAPVEALLEPPKALIDLLETLVDLFETLVDLFETLVDLFEALVDLPETVVNLSAQVIHAVVAPALSHCLHAFHPMRINRTCGAQNVTGVKYLVCKRFYKREQSQSRGAKLSA
jgi:hypothetical protein